MNRSPLPFFLFKCHTHDRVGLTAHIEWGSCQVRRTQNCTFIVFISFSLGLGGEVERQATSDHVCNISFELRFIYIYYYYYFAKLYLGNILLSIFHFLPFHWVSWRYQHNRRSYHPSVFSTILPFLPSKLTCMPELSCPL